VEPLSRVTASVESMATSAAGSLRHRFPEERTVALLAEDLLGRALDEAPGAPTGQAPWQPAGRSSHSSGGGGQAREVGANTRGGDVWDAAMPLVAEG
jgi:hypothetical protein